MKNLTDIGLAILRIAPSSLMLTHGIPKLQKMLGGDFAFANPLGIGEAPSLFLTVIGEVICPILIILGYKTRWAAVPAAITMFVAAFVVHASDPIDVKEKAFLYLFAFVAVIFTGPGSFSIDRK
jgi:putative oxidoreductase